MKTMEFVELANYFAVIFLEKMGINTPTEQQINHIEAWLMELIKDVMVNKNLN